MADPRARIGILGGSGFYQFPGLQQMETVSFETPFGRPSDDIVLGMLAGERVAFLPRHGRNHSLLPSEIPVRANIYALKSLGVEFVISVSAVGSLKKELAPLDLVTPDQLIDRTRGQRAATFFGNGLVAHVGLAEPFCPELRRALGRGAEGAGARLHAGGTMIVIEGPAFSTRAESELYRSWGAHVIGMTALPEAKLAREAELCYAVLACVTDYDVWHPSEAAVTAELIIANLRQNVALAQEVVHLTLAHLPQARSCLCANALRDALVTPLDRVPNTTKETLQPIIGKYILEEASKP